MRFLSLGMLILAFAGSGSSLFAQADTSFLGRMQAIRNGNIDFYNVDGMRITTQTLETGFSPKAMLKAYRLLKIKPAELTQSDSSLDFPNLYTVEAQEQVKGLPSSVITYFVEKPDKQVLVCAFSVMRQRNEALERSFVRLARVGALPKELWHDWQMDSVHFAGRYLPLRGRCHWMEINSLQCPYNGQIDWSTHRALADAAQHLDDRRLTNEGLNRLRSVSDTVVNVVLEGIPTQARRLVYGVKGLQSALLSMSGAKTLTVYYVAATVRQRHLSCVMSHWNSDGLNANGLPALLASVMTLQ